MADNTDDTVVVHPEHIHVMLWAAMWLGRSHNRPVQWSHCTDAGQWITHRLTRQHADTVGQMLLDTNTAAVNAAYGTDEIYCYAYQSPRHHEWDVIEVLKALDYYEYQCAQLPSWPHSEAFVFCFALRAAAIAHMPGYRDAPWHITPETAPTVWTVHPADPAGA